MFRKPPILFLSLLLILLNSCRRDANLPEMVDAHYLLYQIEYLEDTAGDIPTRILPSTMQSWYTKQFVIMKIEGFLKQFSLIQLADLKHRRVTTLLNVFGNKLYYRSRQGQLPAGVIVPQNLSFRNTRESTVIGGLQSNRVEVDTGEEKFNIYFTEDFSVRRPNLSTPYREIDKPLSAFPIQLSYLKMNLTCKLYEERTVESKLFSIPDEYREVSRPVMEGFINSLFTKD